MNPQHLQLYRELRQRGLASRHALACSRARMALESQCAATGFEWREDRHGLLSACWQEDGFDLRAVVVIDEDGWCASGVDFIGRFTSRWEPGAIRHRQGDRNAHKWFVPANLGDPKQEYRRACAFGRDWWYSCVEVKASRAGVTLGDGCLYGIEYDGGCGSDREYLTQTAFDLASQAISEASEKLRTLCGCH